MNVSHESDAPEYLSLAVIPHTMRLRKQGKIVARPVVGGIHLQPALRPTLSNSVAKVKLPEARIHVTTTGLVTTARLC